MSPAPWHPTQGWDANKELTSHETLTITGTLIFTGSWLFLLFGSGADDFRSVVNLHKLVIAHAGIVSGLGLIIAGLVAKGLTGTLPDLMENKADLPPAPIETATRERTMSAEELAKALAEARTKLNQS